ncbi:putative 26S proteasome regulatory subunit [Clavispora lusitaniae]|uniref:26S proteasome regulatory subunit n=1 Tax=Clavispora lusitaniae TaxID=36911 RepID=A0AA91T230_CLALS|nr:putative 26S proteasome regulatory subunit [Clavispora lusitaniae]
MHIITIQDSFEAVISDVSAGIVSSESFWIARRRGQNEAQELHHITVSNNGSVEFSGSVQFERQSSGTYRVAFGNDAYTLVTPVATVKTTSDDVTAVAITSDGSRLVVGSASGSIATYDTATKTPIGSIRHAHLLAVSGVYVFPSDKVVLSTGDDFSAKLWPMPGTPEASQAATSDSTTKDFSDGTTKDFSDSATSDDTKISVPANTVEATRTFRHQKKAITGAVLIGRGRNFATASLDGSVDLWECGSGAVVSSFRRIASPEDPAQCLAVGTCDTPVAPQDRVKGELLFDCDSAALYVGYASGTVQQYNIAGHFQTPHRLSLDSPISAIAVCGAWVVVGTSDGRLVMWDPSTDSQHALELDMSEPIEHIAAHQQGQSVVVVLSNGPESLLRVTFDAPNFSYEYLVGLSELFRVRSVHSNGTTLVVATQDELAFFGVEK